MPLSKLEGCINFIARNGDLANLTGSDMKVILQDHTDRTVAIVAGEKEVFGSRAAAFGVAGASAHLIDGNTLIWQEGKDKPHVRLYYAASGQITANNKGVFDLPLYQTNSYYFDRRAAGQISAPQGYGCLCTVAIFGT